MRPQRWAIATAVLAVCAGMPLNVGSESVSAASDPAPYYEQILPECPRQLGVPNDPCHLPGNVPDAPGIVIVPCSTATDKTKFCYEATVDGKPAPPELKILGYLTAYRLHDASFSDAQLEANIIAFHVPAGSTLAKGEMWGWGKRPTDQANGGGGKVDLSPILTENSVIKVVMKYQAHRMPQYSVLVAQDGTMGFSLTGQDLTLTVEGKPARVAIENATQHIDFDTERSDDTTKPWADRCGIPSMNFVVCNVGTAESNPLLFYARSSSFINGQAAEVPGPIWASTNATYFHQPSLGFDGGKRQIKVKVAAPHFLADGKTVNSGSFRTFLPNGILTQWGIEKTDAGLNSALAASVKKDGVESVVDRSFTISDIGVTITFPSLTYSSPEVFITGVSTVGGQNANQVYAALLAGKSVAVTTTVAPAVLTGKILKRGSTVLLTKLIKPIAGIKSFWKVTGACRIVSGKLAAITKNKTCVLSLRQTNPKTKAVTSKTLKISVT